MPTRVVRSFLFAGAAVLRASSVQAADVGKQKAQIDAGLDGRGYAHLDAVYKGFIHEHPELAMQETRTAALAAGLGEMRALGFEVTERFGGTGIVAIYKNGPGPMVMVRTELDALPMEEKTGAALRHAMLVADASRQGHASGPQLRPRHPHGRLGRRRSTARGDEEPVCGVR